jgi:sulfatase modifying factor 1
MGSPPDEPERYEDEVQHEVTLSRGFWLADTACTQAFWQAVTGSNPSGFKDDPRNPVEQVSWDDVQAFIAELERRLPGLPVRLPTEAEWEYACRAGTTTPFSFGENITPELVNYDGNYPYAGGEKGLYRQKTVPVASLPANPWGLYEMHGNVWEWCADWYGDYPTEPQVDPQGPQTGDDRVLRGGSWSYIGGYVRSAYRHQVRAWRTHRLRSGSGSP